MDVANGRYGAPIAAARRADRGLVALAGGSRGGVVAAQDQQRVVLALERGADGVADDIASCNSTHPGERAAPSKCTGRVAARYGAAGRRPQPDQGNRAGSSETIRAAARDRTTHHGTASVSGRRHRH